MPAGGRGGEGGVGRAVARARARRGARTRPATLHQPSAPLAATFVVDQGDQQPESGLLGPGRRRRGGGRAAAAAAAARPSLLPGLARQHQQRGHIVHALAIPDVGRVRRKGEQHAPQRGRRGSRAGVGGERAWQVEVDLARALGHRGAHGGDGRVVVGAVVRRSGSRAGRGRPNARAQVWWDALRGCGWMVGLCPRLRAWTPGRRRAQRPARPSAPPSNAAPGSATRGRRTGDASNPHQPSERAPSARRGADHPPRRWLPNAAPAARRPPRWTRGL